MQQNLSIKVALDATNKMTAPMTAARKAAQGLSSSIKATQDNLRALDTQARKFDKATAAVSKSEAAMNAAREKIKSLRQEFGRASDRTEAQKAQIDALRKEVGKLTRAWQAETDNLNQTRAAFYRLGVSVRDGQAATEHITTRTQQYNDQLSRQEALLKRVTQAQATHDRTKKLTGKLAGAGAKVGAAGGAMVWGGLRAMRPGIEFDQAYSQTLANAQLDRSSTEGRALREQAKMLSRTTHYSAVQATQGQSALISGGMGSADARRALPSILNMALAGHVELGEAADIGSNILDHFQMNAGQAERVADVMVGTFTRSKTSLSSLNETMEYVGTIANNAGVGLETTAAAAAMLAKNGLKGSIAGTGLKEAMSGLYAPSTAGEKALKGLHIRTVTATGAVRPLADLMQELWNKTRRFDQASQFRIFQTIFGKEGMTAAQVLARSAAEGKLQEFQAYLESVQGLSKKTANRMTDNFAGDMQMLHSAWDGLWTEMEESADAPLRKIVRHLTTVVQGVTQWAHEHPALTSAIVDTALAVGALLFVGGALMLTLAGILGPLAAVRLSFGVLAGAEGIGGVGAAMEWLGGIADVAFGGIAAVIGGITAPVWGLIALVALAAVAIVKWWGPIKAFVGGLFDGMMEKIAPAVDMLKLWWRDLAAVFSWLWGKITHFLTPLQETKSALDKCASAGQAFGKLIGMGINLALLPLKKLIDGLDWVLRKAGVIPDVVQYAQDKTEALQKHLPPPKKPMVAVWDPVTKKMALKPWDWDTHSGEAPPLVAPDSMPDVPKWGIAGLLKPPGPEFGAQHWSSHDKEEKPPRGGAGGSGTDNAGRLGDIVFKTLPDWIALRGKYEQPLITGPAGSRLVAPATDGSETPSIGTNVSGDINLHIHIDGATHMNPQHIAQEVERKVMSVLNKLKRQQLGSLKDRE
ncbi:phage tail tape measure protein [Serratia bockelmannii]|uniref:phage tail tape measure protein n=1 Tax=Serratia bockelmannii TaxID=2703793 RepID=UPI003FA70C68